MTSSPPGPSRRRDLAQRISAHRWLKCSGVTGFIAAFFVAYFLLLRFPVFAVTVMPFTALDRLIPFQPGALWLYLSLWFYVSLPPMFLRTREELYAYGWMAGAVALIGLGIFFFWPTTIPVIADIDWDQYAGYAGLKSVDAAQNACPSLHVAFAVFSGVWLDRMLRTTRLPGSLRLLSAVWCLGIVYSTLATRQHVFVDVAAGLALGLLTAAYRPKALRGAGAVLPPNP